MEEYNINSRTLPSKQSILFKEAKKSQDQPPQEDVQSKINTATKTTQSTMSDAMVGLMKRGEKLMSIEKNTGQMKDDAEDYKNMAGDLKSKMKKKSNFFGI